MLSNILLHFGVSECDVTATSEVILCICLPDFFFKFIRYLIVPAASGSSPKKCVSSFSEDHLVLYIRK